MIDFTSPAYLEARWRVKINHFTEQGLQIKGIVHVGANDGYEMQFYEAMGIKNLLGVEPLPSTCKKFREKYPHIKLLQLALGDVYGDGRLHVVEGDGQGSSLLVEANPNPQFNFLPDRAVFISRWEDAAFLHCIDVDLYDCLVMDVQGYEWHALQGFGRYLDHFNMLSIELSREPVYHGGVPAQVVCDWLDGRGFYRDSPIEEHDDVFFIRRGLHVPHPGRRIGQ